MLLKELLFCYYFAQKGDVYDMNKKIKFLILSLFLCTVSIASIKQRNNAIYANKEDSTVEITGEQDKDENNTEDDQISPYSIDQYGPPRN